MKTKARTEFHPTVRTSLALSELACIMRQLNMTVVQYTAPFLTTQVSINGKSGLKFGVLRPLTYAPPLIRGKAKIVIVLCMMSIMLLSLHARNTCSWVQ